MKALVIKPHNYPEMWELPDLKAMQECVGGHIQAIYPWPDVPAALVCDEDGLAHDSEWNRYIHHSPAADLQDISSITPPPDS